MIAGLRAACGSMSTRVHGCCPRSDTRAWVPAQAWAAEGSDSRGLKVLEKAPFSLTDRRPELSFTHGLPVNEPGSPAALSSGSAHSSSDSNGLAAVAAAGANVSSGNGCAAVKAFSHPSGRGSGGSGGGPSAASPGGARVRRSGSASTTTAKFAGRHPRGSAYPGAAIPTAAPPGRGGSDADDPFWQPQPQQPDMYGHMPQQDRHTRQPSRRRPQRGSTTTAKPPASAPKQGASCGDSSSWNGGAGNKARAGQLRRARREIDGW